MEIRNIAIIAHVDHGKTTLVDSLLQQSDTLRENFAMEERAMDTNVLERERGITILAKNTAINYKGVRINILDTPGHADFGGEVERIMNMVDAVILVVDAFEGTMPQTRFVLNKALEANVLPLVVINKVDRDFAKPLEIVDEVIDLFIELQASDAQLNFPIIYASGLKGLASFNHDFKDAVDMKPLLDTILSYVPAPVSKPNDPLLFQPSLLDYNEYVGRIGIGKIIQGTFRINEMVACVRLDGTFKQFRIQKLYGFLGLNKVEVDVAYAGDIVAIAGLPDIHVGETVCNIGFEQVLPPIHIDEPTVQMTFGTNTGPFVGREGKLVTSSKLEERLYREVQKDVSLKVERGEMRDEWVVSGRGELHLGILIENMRREGYEFQVSRPRVIIKEIDGVLCEPYEHVQVDVPNDVIGAVIELLGNRRGVMESMNHSVTQTRLIYTMPSRGLIGLMTDFMTATKGYGVINHTYLEYRERETVTVGKRKLGVLVSMLEGLTTAYALGAIEDRGIMFVEPRTSVYEGMIVGEANKEFDLAVNAVREKQMSNMRSAGKDSTVVLKRPRLLSLEACLEFINDDELVEITPKSIRLRKKILNTNERKKSDKYQNDATYLDK
jgi:GTP-binding protein